MMKTGHFHDVTDDLALGILKLIFRNGSVRTRCQLAIISSTEAPADSWVEIAQDAEGTGIIGAGKAAIDAIGIALVLAGQIGITGGAASPTPN